MQFVNMRELSRSPSKYVKAANEENDVVITKNGHPYALLLKINDQELEDFILSRHFNLEKEFETAKQEFVSGKTMNARKLLHDVSQSI